MHLIYEDLRTSKHIRPLSFCMKKQYHTPMQPCIFKPLNLSEIPTLKKYVDTLYNNHLCDWTVGGIFMWRDYYQMEFCMINDTLVLKGIEKITDSVFFTFPYTKNLKEVLDVLKQYCSLHKIACVLKRVDERIYQYVIHNENCLNSFRDPDFFDYIYRQDDLMNFREKKYNSQRNHIHLFEKNYPDATFKQGPIDVQTGISFLDEFYKHKEIKTDFELEEKNKTYEVMRNQDMYRFDTVSMWIKGKLCGISFNENINDMCYQHIEKVFVDIQGGYQMMVKASASLTSCMYINREEDCGDAGLRYSKEKYRPCKKLYKYTMEIRYENH